MLKIGLTGGIASGKSSASQFFKELAVDIIDADQIARDLFKPSSPHLNDLRQQFGNKIFDSQGELNRKALGKIVFSDPVALDWLNSYTHPLINKKMNDKLAEIKSPYAILDIPLLVNTDGIIPAHLEKLIDRVLVITSDKETQIERIIARDKILVQQANRIIASQSTWAQKRAKADDVIENNADLLTLKAKITKLHEKYLLAASSY